MTSISCTQQAQPSLDAIPAKQERCRIWGIFFLSLIPAVANIFRSIQIGDYVSYYDEFMNIDSLIHDIGLDSGYYILFYIINKLSFGTWAFFPLITTFISYFFTLFAIQKYGENINVDRSTIRWGYCIILLNPQFFLFSGHMVKMWMAYAFCLYAFVCLIGEARTKCFAATCMALLCHAGSVFIAGTIFLIHLLCAQLKRKFSTFLLLLGGILLFLILLRGPFAGHVQSRLDSIGNNSYTDYFGSNSLPHLVLLSTTILCSFFLLFLKKKYGKQLCLFSLLLLFSVILLRDNYMITFRVLSFLYFIYPLFLLSVCEDRYKPAKFGLLCFLCAYFLLKTGDFSFFWT